MDTIPCKTKFSPSRVYTQTLEHREILFEVWLFTSDVSKRKYFREKAQNVTLLRIHHETILIIENGKNSCHLYHDCGNWTLEFFNQADDDNF